MNKYRKRYAQTKLLLLGTLLILASVCLSFKAVKAASLSQKSITMTSVSASSVTNHQFKFDITSAASLGSIAFQYCETPLLTDPCTAPSGLDASGVSLSSQSGQTSFTIHPNTVSNRIVITRPIALSVPGTVLYNFNNITNPDTPNHTTYVRITTYSNIDATGNFQDSGVVAFSIAPALGVNVFIPPYLTFCAGITVGLQCETANGLNIDLGILKTSQVSTATTQFAGATNDATGYNVSILGTTMTSGNNEISRLAFPSASVAGVQQFGINIRDNSSPNAGHNPEGSGSLSPASSYGLANVFKFNPGDVISSSAIATDYNRMTVTYIVNVKPDQPPGIYSTTLTYVAMASF